MANEKKNYHVIFPTRFGIAGIRYRNNPFALIGVHLPRDTRKSLIESLKKDLWGKFGSHRTAILISRTIIDYFKGQPIEPSWDWMPLNGFTELEQSVYKAVADIPYGQVRTYRHIAGQIRRPKAYRFVGNTLAKNPFPVLIPCHRVIRSDHTIGNFGGGSELKRRMIEMEEQTAPEKE